MFHQQIQHKSDLPVDDEVAFTYGRVLRNIRGDETVVLLDGSL